jgi:hypothetical protein
MIEKLQDAQVRIANFGIGYLQQVIGQQPEEFSYYLPLGWQNENLKHTDVYSFGVM